MLIIRSTLLISILSLLALAQVTINNFVVKIGDSKEMMQSKLKAIEAEDVTDKTGFNLYQSIMGKQESFWWQLKDKTIVGILLASDNSNDLKVTTIEIGEPGKGLKSIKQWRNQNIQRISSINRVLDTISYNDLNEKYIVLGKLNLPLGTVTEIEGKIVDGKYLSQKQYEGKWLISISKIGERKIEKAIVSEIVYDFKNNENSEIGKIKRFIAYEIGSYSGIPDNTSFEWTDHTFSFNTRIKILKELNK